MQPGAPKLENTPVVETLLPDISRFEPNKTDFNCKHFLSNGTYGLSRLWIADHKPSKTIVLIRKTKLDNLEYNDLENLQYETQLSSQLKHPSIMSFHCSFVDNRDIWTAFPFFDYGSCADIIQAGFQNGLPDAAIIYILKSVLQGLEYLHKAGYVHRAIKASHILVCSDGRVCLSGLRYCYPMWSNGHRRKILHNFPSHAVAVLPWIAPEVLEQNLVGYTEKSDIYSVGIMAVELSTGQIPFSGMSSTQIFLEKLNGRLPEIVGCNLARRKSTDPCNSTSDLMVGEREKRQASPLRIRSMSTPQAMSRRFDSTLQQFVEACVDRKPHHRPSATSLIGCSFFKQAKKSRREHSNISDMLRPISPIVDLSKLKSGPCAENDDNEIPLDIESMVIIDDWDI
eukprot:Seg433.1 transcript_id=Seg433.1/GoldUCD/mRNA.D3Y31 product="STE20-related kinase adapter protein alpha" protein_id=Seg433.1/GoldUCD/D3Y31